MHKIVNFLDIKISALTLDEIVEKILEFAIFGKRKMVTYLNANCVNISFTDFEYKKILQKSDLVYAGGQGVVWASKFIGSPLPERVNILDFFDILVRKLRDKKITIYLLGGRVEIVKKTEGVLKKKGLKIVGSRDGFFDKTEEMEIIQEINFLKPDILMVGMGVPRQEKWIHNYLNKLDVNLYWAVGAAFGWLSGYRKRAPIWMIRCGLEWLYRLYQEPKRLWRRYLIGNFIFIYHVLRWRLQSLFFWKS